MLFKINFGIYQGGVKSPWLLNVFMDKALCEVRTSWSDIVICKTYVILGKPLLSDYSMSVGFSGWAVMISVSFSTPQSFGALYPFMSSLRATIYPFL